MLCQLSLIGQTTINQIAAKQDQPSINNIAVIRNYGLNSFDLRDYSVEGSPYFKDHWCKGEIELYDGKILDDIPFRYNILNNSLAVKMKGRYYEIPSEVVKSFKIFETNVKGDQVIEQFVRIVKDYQAEFFELIQESESLKLLKNYSVKISKANYNAALDVGDHNDKMIRDTNYAIWIDNELIEIKGSNKKIIRKLKNKKLKRFVNENKLNLKNIDDLVFLVSNFKLKF